MSNSFSEFLEAYDENKSTENCTFAELSTCMESLTDFVNEGFDFSVPISLEECVEGVLYEADKKIGEGIKNAIHNFIEKLKAFITKIGDAVKRFIAKAKLVIAQGGNAAISKVIKTNGAVIGKDITLIKPKGKEIVEKGFEAASKACNLTYARINSNIGAIENAAKAKDASSVDLDEIFSRLRLDAGDANLVDSAIKALGKGFETSDVVEKYKVKAKDHKAVKDIYNDHVKVWNDIVKKYVPQIDSTCKEVQKTSKNLIKAFSGIGNEGDKAKLANKMLSEVSGVASKMMQLSTYTLNFGFKVISMSTKNAAKIAISAVGPTGKALVSGAKGKVSDKVDDVKGDIADKQNDNKTAKQSASAFGATKKEDQKVLKRSDVVKED